MYISHTVTPTDLLLFSSPDCRPEVAEGGEGVHSADTGAIQSQGQVQFPPASFCKGHWKLPVGDLCTPRHSCGPPHGITKGTTVLHIFKGLLMYI